MSEKDERDESKHEGGEAGESEPEAAKEPAGESKTEPGEAAKAASEEAKAEPEEAKAEPGEAKAEPPKPGKPEGEGPPSGRPPEREAQAWGRPLARLDAAWTKWEVWLCAVTILLEIVVLTLWVALRGLSTAADGSSKAGLVFRALMGAIVLGLAAYWGLKKQKRPVRRAATMTATVVGLLLAKTWGNLGVDWSSNILNWYQQASFLTLLGGLRGVGTRLTLLLALLGGSLATAAGKHITIDLVTRYLKAKARLPVVVAGWLMASAICGTAAWGFFDHISIDDFDADADAKAGEKFAKVGHELGEDWFISKKQIKLDLKSIPHVFKGERYSEWMTAAEWNGWVEQEDFAEHYGKDKAESLKLPTDMKRSPIVVVPGKGEPRGELVKAANLVFPIGMLVIAFRFVLLCLLALSGHKSVDPEGHADLGVVPGGRLDRHEGEPTKEDA